MTNPISRGARLLTLSSWTVGFFLLASCNVFSPFEGSGSDQDHIELGEKALEKGDFGGAIAEFGLISDAAIKNDRLCTANISRAGFTITILVDSLQSTSASVLGAVANKLVPWTQTKQDAADAAKTACLAASTTSDAKTAALLKALSNILHCATLMSKTDVLVSDGTTCGLTGPGTGRITTASVGPANGVLSAADKGMCDADATSCRDDLLAIDATALGNAGLQNIQDVYNGIPPDLKDQNSGAAVIRIALRQTL